MSSPLLWGPNNISNNLQNAELTATGEYMAYNGPKNYISYGNMQTGTTTGWALGNIPTLTNGIPTGVPTFGSGASGNLSVASQAGSSVTPNFSLALTQVTTSTTAGDMLHTQAYTIDNADQAKVLTFKVSYFLNAGTGNFSGTSSNSLGIAFYDVTNSVWLSSTANFGFTQSSGVGLATGTVQTGATTAQIRLCIYFPSATAATVQFFFGQVSLGPQTAPIGAPVSDWVAYTPVFTGFGIVTGIAFQSRRVGGNLEVQGVFTAGTTTATQAQITLGFQGASANVSISSTAITTTQLVGMGTFSVVTTQQTTVLAAGGNTFMQIGGQNASVAGLTPLNGSAVMSTGQSLSVHAQFPITGWQSNVQMSNDTDTRVVAMRANNASATVTSSYSNVTWNTVVNDTHGAMGAVNYTIPVSGYYDVSTQVTLAGTQALNGTAAVQVLKNGSIVQENDTGYGGALTTNNSIELSIDAILCNSGDTLSVQVKSSATLPVIGDATNGCFVSIARRSGPSVIAATESVNARYFASSTAPGTFASPTTITYTTKDFDSHNAYSAGTYTIPVSGKFQINAALYQTASTTAANEQTIMQISKNGSAITTTDNWFTSATAKPVSTMVDDCISCNAGDTITILAGNGGTTPATSASNTYNYFSIYRVGN